MRWRDTAGCQKQPEDSGPPKRDYAPRPPPLPSLSTSPFSAIPAVVPSVLAVRTAKRKPRRPKPKPKPKGSRARKKVIDLTADSPALGIPQAPVSADGVLRLPLPPLPLPNAPVHQAITGVPTSAGGWGFGMPVFGRLLAVALLLRTALYVPHAGTFRLRRQFSEKYRHIAHAICIRYSTAPRAIFLI